MQEDVSLSLHIVLAGDVMGRPGSNSGQAVPGFPTKSSQRTAGIFTTCAHKRVPRLPLPFPRQAEQCLSQQLFRKIVYGQTQVSTKQSW